jgi:hypothetical protein
MKTSIKLAGIISLVLFAVAVGWWLSRATKQSAPVAAITQPALPDLQATLPQPPPKPDDLPKILQPFARTPYLRLKDPRWNEYEARQKLDPQSEWKTPIEFYGKVIDEKNQPVPEAEVEVEWVGTSQKYGGDGVGKMKVTSGSNGLFSVNGIEGKRLLVRVSKEGYYRRKAWNNCAFEYGGFWLEEFIEPDRNNPVIFHLVKRPVAEPTLRVRQRSLPKSPKLQTRIDLLAKPAETAVGGDIVLQITRLPNPGYHNPFDWQLNIQGLRGAEIIMSEDEFMLRAPDEGYQKTIAKEYTQVRGNSIETVKFYVRNKARRLYAAVSVEVTPYYPDHATKEDGACFIVSATVNPNDSPNVEYDPKKDIREMAKR